MLPKSYLLFLCSLCILWVSCSSKIKNESQIIQKPTTQTAANEDEVGVPKTTEMIQYVSFPIGYYVKDNFNFANEYEGFIFDNRADFDKIIGFHKTATNSTIILDFEVYDVIVIAHKPGTQVVDFKIQGVLKTEDGINFNFIDQSAPHTGMKAENIELMYVEKMYIGKNKKIKLNGQAVNLNEKF